VFHFVILGNSCGYLSVMPSADSSRYVSPSNQNAVLLNSLKSTFVFADTFSSPLKFISNRNTLSSEFSTWNRRGTMLMKIVISERRTEKLLLLTRNPASKQLIES